MNDGYAGKTDRDLIIQTYTEVRAINDRLDKQNGRIGEAEDDIEETQKDIEDLKISRAKIYTIGTIVVIAVPLILKYVF